MIVEKLRNWEKVYPEDEDKPDGSLYYEAADRIEELEGELMKAVRALEIVDEWFVDLGMYANPDYHLAPSLQHVRDTLKELKDGQ